MKSKYIFLLVLAALMGGFTACGFVKVKKNAEEKRVAQEIVEARTLLDQCCAQEEYLTRAKAMIDDALRSEPTNHLALLELARCELKSGFLNYHSSVNNGPYDYDVDAFQPGTIERASAIVQKAIAAYPRFAEAYVLLARMQINEQEIAAAQQSLTTAEAIGTSDPWLDINYSTVLFATGKFDAGVGRLQRVLHSSVADGRAKRGATQLLIADFTREQRYQEGKELFEQEVRDNPGDIFLRGNFASYLTDNLNLNDDAIAQARQSPAIDSYGDGRRILATALYRKWADLIAERRVNEAAVYFQEADELYSDLESLMVYGGSMPACRNLVDALISEKGVSINATVEDGSTALLVATNLNHTESVRFLLSRHADPNVRDHNGWTPLLSAAQDGNRELAAVLFAAGANIDATINGRSAFDYAVRNNNLEMAAWLEGLHHK